MENDDILQEEVSDVYQKTLMSIPAKVTSIIDTLDNDFITNFIMFFRGSKLGNVQMDASSEACRQKVIELFKEIGSDLNATRNSQVDVLGLDKDMAILQMYLDGNKGFDTVVKRALYNVQNMGGASPEASDIVDKVYDKRQSIKASMKNNGETYEYTLEGIRQHFTDNGIIDSSTGKINADAMMSRPYEVEELMNALARIVDGANDVTAVNECKLVGSIAVSGYNIGKPYLEENNPDDPIAHAAEACRRVAVSSRDRFALLKKNSAIDTETSLSSTVDPYMRFIFGMIQDGKVSKEGNGPITVVDVSKITADEMDSLYEKVKRAMFNLGPTDNAGKNEPVQFDVDFDTNIQFLKAYIDFLNSDELKPVLTKPIMEDAKNLAAAYILTKAVHDTFNGCLMIYSDSDAEISGHNVPSFNKFRSSIKDLCGEYPKKGLDLNYIFNFKVMFTTETAYFPIERIIAQNTKLFDRMCQYRDSCMEAYAANEKNRLEKEGRPVEYIAPKFSEYFNKLMKGSATIDQNCEHPKISTMISETQFIDGFNAVSDGIAYAGRNNINDKETEYKLSSLLKTLANKTPPTLGEAVKQECMNVSHAQEDIMFRMDLAIKAGVVVKTDTGLHFSGNLGTLVNGENIQATRIDRIMKIFNKYVTGLLFEKTNAVLMNKGYGKPMSMNMVKPYLSKVYEIAKEYNIAVIRNNGKSLKCSMNWSSAIVTSIETSMGVKNGR